ncbi:MAG: DciA family protein [Patescibacteria group bacterium]
MFQPLSVFLPAALKKAKIKEQVDAIIICEEFNQIIQDIWDEKIFNQIKVISYKNKILTIAILSSVLASELQLKQEEIIKKINFKFKKNIVKKLYFLI